MSFYMLFKAVGEEIIFYFLHSKKGFSSSKIIGSAQIVSFSQGFFPLSHYSAVTAKLHMVGTDFVA